MTEPPTPPFRHVVDACLADAVGPLGLDRADLERGIAAAAPALDRLRAARADGSLPLLRLPAARDDLGSLRAAAEDLAAGADDVVILGTGGSSLGGRTLAALSGADAAPPARSPRLHFLDNIDPHTFDALLDRLDPTRTGLLAISKSGTTAETLTQFLILLDRLAAAGASLRARGVVITEPGPRPLRDLAEARGMRVLDHDPGVGGRFAAFTGVGLLPALLAGLDPEAVREGAAEVLDAAFSSPVADSAPAIGAAVAVGLARRRGLVQSVLMTYADRLAPFGLWYRQLWAESLGKDGRGTTPIRAIGTVDQHSQLQLYLDGPRDKTFTLVTLSRRGTGARIPAELAREARADYLAGRTMGDLLAAEQSATAETLIRAGLPTRRIELDALDERTLGALMMHFMLETIIAAGLLGVDPFDQPAVEAGKALAREHLAAMAADAPEGEGAA